MLRWLNSPGAGLTDAQRRRARAAVREMWLRRQQTVATRRGPYLSGNRPMNKRVPA